MRREERVCLGAGVAALLPCSVAAFWLATDFLAAWLAAWWFWIGMGVGAQVILWIQRLSGGRWMEPIAAPLGRLRASVLPAGILIVPVLLWPGLLYPWADPSWVDSAKETGFRAVWFTPAAMAIVSMLCVALWVMLTRRREPHGAGYAAAGLLLFGYSVSVAAVTLIASLEPRWYSSAFGLLVLVAQSKLAMAGAVWSGAKPADAPRRNDLGNLLLMYVLTWMYIAFTQFQIIWAENLPAEISWYVPRLQTAWIWLAVALAVLGFALPLLLLLMRAFKRNARCLRGLAGLLAIVGWLEVVWWIVPSLHGTSLHILWLLPLLTAGMGLVLAALSRASARLAWGRSRVPKGESNA